MKKKYLKYSVLAAVLVFSAQQAKAQQGFGTNEPSKASAIEMKSNSKGLLIPRVALTSLNNFAPITGESPNAVDKTAALLVYNTATAGSVPNNVTPGYYYWTTNGTTGNWVRIADNSDIKAEPWRIQNTTTEATANTENIYQQGKVAVGFTDADAVSGKQFEVKGDVKSVTNNAGTYSVLETNNTNFGAPFNVMLTADNPDVLAATAYGAVTTTLNESALSVSGANGDGSIGVDNGAGFSSPRAEIRVNKADNTVTNAVVVGSNGETEVVDKIYLRSENITAGTATRLLVDKAEGVTFKHGNIAAPTGNYTFPQNNGTAGQVLVTDGAAPTLMTGAQLSWADASSLITIPTEPWQVQGGTTQATTNAENIYQTGNVSIGSSTPIAPFLSGGNTITPKLSVTGDVATTGAFYTTNSVFADYVFEKYFDGASKINNEYEFKSLDYIREFVEKNKHLPGVTKIDDLIKDENGYMFDMTKLSIQQLEKIEELFLHVIEQHEEIKMQNTEIKMQNTEIKTLKDRLQRLEDLLVNNKQ